MCLASRLSTQANLGNMNSTKEVINMIIGNIALVQVQATVAAFIVGVFAISIGAAMSGEFHFDHAMLLVASSIFTATSSCFVLGEFRYLLTAILIFFIKNTWFFVLFLDFVLVAVILLSNRFKMNPDNLATPLAASIGDVVSISLLSFIASLLFENIGKFFKVLLKHPISSFKMKFFWFLFFFRVFFIDNFAITHAGNTRTYTCLFYN